MRRFTSAGAAPGRIRTFLLLLLAFALVASLPAFSQGITSGSMSGTITDPTGAVVAGAKVTATNLGTNVNLTTTSNNVGFWALHSVPIGPYKVTVETPNFQKLEVAGVDVAVARETSLGSMKLALARTTEVVEVQEAPPVLETTTSQVTTNFQTKTVAQLPLAGGIDALALYIPGVANSGDNSFSNTNGADISANGLRSRNNNFQIDGQANNDNSVAGPSLFMGNEEAIGEVNIITNNFGVEFGRNSGSIVNYVTKSGTNNLHGSVFEYNTNSLFDAHSSTEISSVGGYCPQGVSVGTKIDLTGKPDPAGDPCRAVAHPAKYLDNRYGGSLGGPVVRNKVWFFGSYMEEKERSAGAPYVTSSITPTPAGLATLAAAFPGNAAVNALNTIGPYAVTRGAPQPFGSKVNHLVSNGVGVPVSVEFAGLQRNPIHYYNDWELVGKVDAQVTNKDRLSTRYNYQKNISTVYNSQVVNGGWLDTPGKGQQIALDWVRTVTNNVVNQARFSYSRMQVGWSGGAWDNCTALTITNCPTNITMGGSNLSLGVANNLPQGRLINVSQWQDNASWVRGRHTFKFGGEYDRQRSPNTFVPNLNGAYTFGSSTTGCAAQFPGILVSPVTGLPSATDCGFSRFLANDLGSTGTLNLANGSPSSTFKEQDMAFYAGDDWRIKDNLTLNLGLRWEFSTQAFNLLHQQTVANMASSHPLWDPTLPASITTFPEVPNNYHYFAPNVGFAWTPKGRFLGNGKTVIRGGGRIAYDPAFYNMFINAASAAPVINLGSLTRTTCTAPCLPTSGFFGTNIRAAHLADVPSGAGVNPGSRNRTEVAPDFHEPRTYMWSLGVEREITKAVAFESRYVGNKATGNFQTINANPSLAGLTADFPTTWQNFVPAGVTPCASPTLSNGLTAPGYATQRVDCNFTNVRLRANTSWSYYHGWQNQLRVNGWHGVTAGVSYTYSRTIDTASEIFANNGGGQAVAGSQNPFDWSKGEKGLSALDFPHTASVYFLYDLPFYKAQKGFLGHLLGGYGFNTAWRYSSGQVWTPLQIVGGSTSCQNSFNSAFLGSLDTCRPFLGNPSAPVDTVGQCTNAAAADCGLVNYWTGAPTTKSAVRFIYNDDTAAQFFGTPYGTASRSPKGLRGDTTNNASLTLSKNTKIAERVTMRFEAQVFNVLNRDFRGVPDTWLDDGNFAAALQGYGSGSYGNTYWNSTGYGWSGGGIGRRRMVLGAKFTF